jgi:tryptophan-rich sensory protein
MKLAKLIIFFMIVNFGGLAIGSWLMNNGPTSLWYTSLQQAPWTPPGWVFGVAWTTIMLCFSIYLGFLFLKENKKKLKIIYSIQVILNVSWNYLFFNQHLVALALLSIVLLTAVVFYFFFKGSHNLKKIRYLLVPYMIWLCIATSLNLYILIYN